MRFVINICLLNKEYSDLITGCIFSNGFQINKLINAKKKFYDITKYKEDKIGAMYLLCVSSETVSNNDVVADVVENICEKHRIKHFGIFVYSVSESVSVSRRISNICIEKPIEASE